MRPCVWPRGNCLHVVEGVIVDFVSKISRLDFQAYLQKCLHYIRCILLVAYKQISNLYEQGLKLQINSKIHRKLHTIIFSCLNTTANDPSVNRFYFLFFLQVHLSIIVVVSVEQTLWQLKNVKESLKIVSNSIVQRSISLNTIKWNLANQFQCTRKSRNSRNIQKRIRCHGSISNECKNSEYSRIDTRILSWIENI